MNHSSEIDQEWVSTDDDEIERMHQNSLTIWVQKMEKIKNWILKK